MVAKITGGSSIFGVLKYNIEKVENEKAGILYANNACVFNEKMQPDMLLMMQTFETYLKNNKRTKEPVFHASLNPHLDDKLTDQQLKEIAGEYMQKLGYGEQPYIVFKHSDIQREHIHIVSIRIDINGKKLNDSFEHRCSDQIRRELEKKYNLRPADRQQKNDIQELKQVDCSSNNLKKQIGSVVKQAVRDYKFQSVNELRALLSLYNVTVEEVKGVAKNGSQYAGLVYSATDQKGERVGNPFKASLFGKSTGYEAIQKQIAESTTLLKSPVIKNKMKNEILECMNASGNRVDFEKRLKTKGINVIFRENAEGRIYGVTFVNDHDKVVLNGSRLGKDFSANAFNDFFTQGSLKQPQPEQRQERAIPEIKPDLPPNGNNLFNLSAGDNSTYGEEKPIKPKKKKRRQKKIS